MKEMEKPGVLINRPQRLSANSDKKFAVKVNKVLGGIGVLQSRDLFDKIMQGLDSGLTVHDISRELRLGCSTVAIIATHPELGSYDDYVKMMDSVNKRLLSTSRLTTAKAPSVSKTLSENMRLKAEVSVLNSRLAEMERRLEELELPLSPVDKKSELDENIANDEDEEIKAADQRAKAKRAKKLGFFN